MVKDIENSLVKYLADNGLHVGVGLSNNTRSGDIITLAFITPEVFSVGDNVLSSEYHFYINVVSDLNHEKLDKYLKIKTPAEEPFTIYNTSSGTAVEVDDCVISMPNDITFKVPFGDVFVDEIVIKIRRYK